MNEWDHRDFLYGTVGWELMDLRHDIEFADRFMKEPYAVSKIIERLRELQDRVGSYADAHFPASAGSDHESF